MANITRYLKPACVNLCIMHVCVFTVTLALLLRIRVIEESLPIVSPGHAAEFDPLQSVLQKYSAVHAQELDLNPVRAARAGAVRQVLAILRERVT